MTMMLRKFGLGERACHLITGAVLLAITAIFLTGCNRNTTKPGAEKSPDANELVELPPSITASHTYRCRDNSVINADFFQGRKRIDLRLPNAANSVQLTSSDGNDVFIGGGIKATVSGLDLTIDRGSAGELTCKRA